MPSDWRELYRKWDGIQKHMRSLEPTMGPRGTTSRPVITRTLSTNYRRTILMRNVCLFYNCHFNDLIGGSHKRNLDRARPVLMWLLYYAIGMSWEQIGALLHRDDRHCQRYARYAYRRYEQDIHKILTIVGMGDGRDDPGD